jgi:membrane protein implicated in regulation of membrane protease activity
MNASGAGYSGLELFFLICAFIGGGLFIARFVVQFFAGNDGVDSNADVDITAGHGDVVHTETDISFRLLTLQGLTAFFMMFGLVGFAMVRESRMNGAAALAGALAAGTGTVWLIGKIFSSVKKLQSSGTMDNAAAVGEQGTVYLTIRANSRGKIQVPLKGRIREFEAVAKTGEEIKTGEQVKVVDMNGSVAVVEKSRN